jgi:predicted TIM-barrel fold metal-dependent hydrolase
VLLHCYPFVREAGWLAHVYGNVYFDLSLTIPHVSRPAVALAEALELAPVSKLLYASDAARTPELYLLAAIWWRDALAAVLPEALHAAAAEDAARMILRENAPALPPLGLAIQPSCEGARRSRWATRPRAASGPASARRRGCSRRDRRR